MTIEYEIRPVIYLACPLASKDDLVVYGRIQSAMTAERILIQNGFCVINPVVIGTNSQADLSDREWVEYDLNYMRGCSAIFVMTLDGYASSAGVKKERAYARQLDIPEFKVSYADLYDEERLQNLSKMLAERVEPTGLEVAKGIPLPAKEWNPKFVYVKRINQD